jgi:cell division protein FtsQ
MPLFRSSKPARGRRRSTRKRRRQHLLEVTATAETERRRRNQKLFLYVAEAALLVGLIAFTWFGIRTLFTKLLFDNDQYRVRIIEVNTDGVMSREALERTGVREGLNIFSLNLDSAQRALASIPEVKEARVERNLPETVTISIEARRPVAWVAPQDTGLDPSAMEAAFLVDADGIMMKPDDLGPGMTRLPVVYGVPTGIPLRAADIGKGWCIEAWADPQTRYTFGLDDLPAQLDRLQMIMLHVGQTSRQLATVNLIPARNTPVTFQDDQPAAAPEIRRAEAVQR